MRTGTGRRAGRCALAQAECALAQAGGQADAQWHRQAGSICALAQVGGQADAHWQTGRQAGC